MKRVFNVFFADTVSTEITNMKQGTRITCAVCCVYEVRKTLCDPAPLVMSLRKPESMIEHAASRRRPVSAKLCMCSGAIKV
jgi:hypothetical protein